jgi:diguanylate cyclase (GGDEF)-like protein
MAVHSAIQPGVCAPTDAPAAPAPLEEVQQTLRQLDRRDWSLWVTAVVILVLLCVAIVSLSFPTLWRQEQVLSQEQIATGIKGLFGLVLLFAVFAIHQQYKMKQLRGKLQSQIAVVSEVNARAEAVERLSILDPLTSLFNRRFALEYLTGELTRCERNNHSLIIALIDLDNFKAANERLGRAAGNTILMQFGYHIKKAIRSADLPVYMENDQFLIILPECGVGDIYRPLERLRGCEVRHGDETIPVDFSVAWVQRRDGELADELLRRAEEGLKKQKNPIKVTSSNRAATPENTPAV